jgi:hypothetical protein
MAQNKNMTYTQIMPISGWAQQVVIGTVLGGSSLVRSKSAKNCYLSMRGKNKNWLSFKAHEINLPAPHSFLDTGSTLRWHSICSPVLNEIREWFYRDNVKKINDFVLDKLRDIGLMTWFMDSGFIKKKCAGFRVSHYSPDDVATINNYFKLLELNSSIVNNNKIILDELSTIRLMKVIAPVTPEFMYPNLT